MLTFATRAVEAFDDLVGDIHIRRDRAVVCLEADCGAIYSLPRSSCPACGSDQGAALQTWLDREAHRPTPGAAGPRA